MEKYFKTFLSYYYYRVFINLLKIIGEENTLLDSEIRIGLKKRKKEFTLKFKTYFKINKGNR